MELKISNTQSKEEDCTYLSESLFFAIEEFLNRNGNKFPDKSSHELMEMLAIYLRQNVRTIDEEIYDDFQE